MADILVHSGDDLGAKVATAVSGDNVIIDAGVTFDRSSTVTLHNHGSSSNPVTIKSANAALLPSGRVGSSNTANMPRIRTTNANPVFTDSAGGSYWILDGLEITDNSTTDIPVLLDFRNGSKIKVSRVYCHPKEADPDWWRAASRAMWYAGSAGLTVENSDFRGFDGYTLTRTTLNGGIDNVVTTLNVVSTSGFSGSGWVTIDSETIRYTGTTATSFTGCTRGVGGTTAVSHSNGATVKGHELPTSEVLLSISGKNVTITNCFLSAWYGTFFTGGGSAEQADVTATLSGTPTTTSATVSTITGLQVGQYVRVQLHGTGTKSGGSFTRTGGDAITSADVVGYNTAQGYGLPFSLAEAPGYAFMATAITGDVWTVPSSVFGGLADGTYNWEVYEVIEIDSISGNNLTYHGVGIQHLVTTPTAANTTFGWVTGDGSNAADWTITRNEIWKNPAFVNFLLALGYSTAPGKGIWEMKHMKRMVFDGNRLTGYPNALFMRQYNQDGTEPWSTIQDCRFTNNIFETDASVSNIGGEAFSINLGEPYLSAQPGKNVTISNNLVKRGWEIFTTGQFGSNVQINHNTMINTGTGASYHSAIAWGADGSTIGTSGWTFRDNIVSYRNNGATCFNLGGGLSDCWPSGTWANNVVVDTESVGVATNTWGTGSILSPVPTSFASVGFTDQASGNYRLSLSSPYKNLATDGTDPGINQDALEGAQRAATSAAVKLIAICMQL